MNETIRGQRVNVNVYDDYIPEKEKFEEHIKHGKWVDPEDDNGQIEWHCNMCHKVIYTLYGKPPFNYCPHCGARMNLED